MELRIARADERAALIELQRRASLANPGDRAAILAHPEAVNTPLEQFEAGQVVLAEDDGRVLGFAALIPRPDGDVELDALFTEPDAWRRGVGRALVEHCSVVARAAGASAIRVIGNPHAAQFYLATGFKLVGETRTEFGPGGLYAKQL